MSASRYVRPRRVAADGANRPSAPRASRGLRGSAAHEADTGARRENADAVAGRDTYSGHDAAHADMPKAERQRRNLPKKRAKKARIEADGTPRPAGGAKDNSAAASSGIRLNKAIAASGLCSRRKADELILAGRVRVNDAVETNPARHVLHADAVAVDGRLLRAPQALVYVLLHKPVQVVCTAADPEGRPTVLDVLPEEYRGIRLYPVGRLDYFSEGLLLLTNDGQLAQRLAHPRHHQPKTYDVLVRGSVPEAALRAMRRGMRLAEGDETLPAEADASPLPSGDTRLRMVLRQGLNRQIRRMCRDLGLTILRLRRTAQGVLRLGDLPCGAARPLTAQELAGLRNSVGLPSPPPFNQVF